MKTPYGELPVGSHTIDFVSHHIVVTVSKVGFTEQLVWHEGYEPTPTLSPESRIQELEAKLAILEAKTDEHEVLLKGVK